MLFRSMTFSFHRTGKRKKLLFFWVPGFLFPLFMSLIYFLAHAKFSFLDSLRATAASLIPLFGYGLARTPFYEAAMGTDDLLQNLKAMGKALAFVCGALGGGLFCDWIAKENRKKFWRVLFLIANTAIPLHFSFLWLSRAWPILCLAVIFFLICVRRKNLFE